MTKRKQHKKSKMKNWLVVAEWIGAADALLVKASTKHAAKVTVYETESPDTILDVQQVPDRIKDVKQAIRWLIDSGIWMDDPIGILG